ncbi:MAG: diguanylate cyclase [Chitinispirillales bacterium]|nr:diguanylate cyclase [Chitinispirillales bacterium]
MYNIDDDKENLQILVVDDDEFVANLLAKSLKRLYSTEIVDNISDAVKIFEEKYVDILITDLNLGDESGITLAKIARKYDPNIEIIFITGFASFENAKIALDLGIVEYMTKPIDIGELFSTVEKTLHMRKFNMKAITFSQSIKKEVLELGKHVDQVISIHKLLQKMNQAIDINDTANMLLTEISKITDSKALIMGINVLGYLDIYAYSSQSALKREDVVNLLTSFWRREMINSGLSLLHIRDGTYPLVIFNGNSNDTFSPHKISCTLTSSISIFGEEIGFISVYNNIDAEIDENEETSFYIITPLIAPALYRGYLEKKTRYLAQTDGLTGVTNRRVFNEIMIKEITAAIQNKMPLSLLMIDIDFFKKINDTYGHLVGDDVLKKMAEIISKIIRKRDNLARFGGEEFTIIYTDSDIGGAVDFSEKIRKAIENYSIKVEDSVVKFTVSIGVSCFYGDVNDITTTNLHAVSKVSETLIKNSDVAMYAAKQNGRNCVYYFDEKTNKANPQSEFK